MGVPSFNLVSCAMIPLRCSNCLIKSQVTVALPHQRENPVSENGYKQLEIRGWKTLLANGYKVTPFVASENNQEEN